MSTYTVAMRLPTGARVLTHIDAQNHYAARNEAILAQASRRPFHIPSAALVLIPKETPQ